MKQQDPALKQVLQEQEDIRLSPNFCYRTLQRVEELARQRRQREERRFFRAIVATAACLAAGCVITLYIYCGESLGAAFGSLLTAFTGPAFSTCLQLGVLILLLLGLDHGMRRMYQSHKKKASRHGNN